MELDDATKENEEWMSNFKYLKLKAFVDLCKKHGVLLYIYISIIYIVYTYIRSQER